MEVIINAVVGKIVEVFTGQFLTSTGRQIGYVVHYKKNMEDLDAKVQNLREVMGTIKGKVDDAEQSGEDIEKDVSNWLLDVNKKEEDLNKLLEDRENVKSCVHVCSRYRLSKKGKTLLYDVSGLIDVGSKIVTVGRPAIWYTATTNFELFKSRESVRKQIIKVLKDDINYKVGIYGMGGSGKTRMAEEIAKQAKKEKLFDDIAKAVFSQSPDLTKIQEELADCLNLSFTTKTNVGRKGELYNRLKKGEKILVIIDDIWNDEIKLEEIGIPSSNNHIKGCKVLLTSREEDVCIQMGVQENFSIELLQEHEAWYLFQKIVGDFIESPHEIHSVANQVCRECDRLILAILVVGAALRNQKQKHTWDDALVQLRNCKGENIKGVTKKLYSRIEWSYQYQKQLDVKSCFLHCSLFPEDAEIPIDDLVMYGVTTRFLKDNFCTIKTSRDRTLVLVDTLKKSHLLLEGESKDFVKMHDVIRDVAISIASKEGFLAKTGVPKWPEKDEYESHKVISLRSKNICELPCELECSELRTLVLECDISHRPQAPDSFFKRTKKVEVLDLHHVRLPSSLLNLINLRMLRLCNCGHVNLAFLKELRNLEILGIADSNLKQVAVEVGQLTTLRWLDLRRCTKLEIIPSCVIKSLSNIEELYIPCDFGGWGDEGNAGLDELNSLTRLTNLQIHIGDGMLLPNELCFELLNRFKISIGRTSGFEYYEENVGGAKMLKLDDITLRKEFTILMAKADVLVLERMEGLKNVLHFGDGKGFLELKYLKIEDCSDMEHLLGRPKWNLQTRDSFSKLNVLIVKNCTLKFLFFPSMARALLQLQKLDISNCQMMEEIILDDEEVMDRVIFCQLKEMNLQYLPIFRSICGNKKKMSTTECNTSTDAQALFNEIKVSFPALEKLDIRELNSVTTICMGLNRKEQSDHRVHSYLSLTSVSINSCNSLRNVFSSSIARNLPELQYLSLTNCEKIDEIIAVESGQTEEEVTEDDEIIVFPQLKYINLRLLPGLKSFWFGSKKAAVEPQVQVQALFNDKVSTSFQQLTSLTIDSCHSLINVFSPSIAKNLRQLQELRVRDCEKIEEIIAVETVQEEEETTDDEIIVFHQLKKMKLASLPNLKSFWSSTCGSNKEAVEDDIPQVHALFNYKVKFPSLEFFELGSINNLKEIWNTTVPIDYFCKLRRLRVDNCDELLSVAPSKLVGSFHNLEELYIWMCPSLEEMFKVEGKSNNAEEGIVVARDKDIEEDLETISELPSLVKMDITNCPKLKSAALYTSKKKVVFPILETLGLSDESIFEDIWYGHVPAGSFSKVRKLMVKNCNTLVNVPTLLQRFEVVEELTVFNCSSLEVVFNLEGLEDIERGRITKLELLAFHNLRSLTVSSCNSLKYLFSLEMARNLTKIEFLEVCNCDAIEEVIRNEDQGEEDGVMDEIVFPKLKSMNLRRLANLISFCGANNAFKLPYLQIVWLRECPKMQTFTSGRISTQLIELFDENYNIHKVCDLNKYVEECVQKRKGRDAEETSLANKIEETSEETRLGDEIKDDEETS